MIWFLGSRKSGRGFGCLSWFRSWRSFISPFGLKDAKTFGKPVKTNLQSSSAQQFSKRFGQLTPKQMPFEPSNTRFQPIAICFENLSFWRTTFSSDKWRKRSTRSKYSWFLGDTCSLCCKLHQVECPHEHGQCDGQRCVDHWRLPIQWPPVYW